MPIRDKFRRAFGRSPSTSDGSDLTQSVTKSSAKSSKKKKAEKEKASGDNDMYYKLGEQPRPKYRGPYNRQHQEKLHAFSFSNAFSMRRKSQTSEYSPMGSRMPSRTGSLLGRESWGLGRGSRRQSVVDPGMVEGLRENLDEGTDVGNGEFPSVDELRFWESTMRMLKHFSGFIQDGYL